MNWTPSDDDLPYSDETWVDLDDFSSIPLPDNGDGPDYDSWRPINLGLLPMKPPVQPTLGGVGLVYPGKRHVFSGPQESAKTLAAYLIGLEVVRSGQSIIVIDFEMGRYPTRDRFVELGATDDDFTRIHYIEPHEPVTAERIQHLLLLDPALVIIDAAAGAYDLQGLDDNKRLDVERFASLYVKEFWRQEIATIVVDHVVKDSESRGKYAIGSERKVGGADVHLGFEVTIPIQRGGRGLYKIVNHKDRSGYLQRGKVADLSLQSDPETHQIAWELKPAEQLEPSEVWMPTDLMLKVSIYLSALQEPCSRKRILDDVTGRTEYVRRAIDHLVRLGYASETPGERGAKLVSHHRLFHPNDLLADAVENPHGPTWSDLVPGPGHSHLVPVPPSVPEGDGVGGDNRTTSNGPPSPGPPGHPETQLDLDPDLPL